MTASLRAGLEERLPDAAARGGVAPALLAMAAAAARLDAPLPPPLAAAADAVAAEVAAAWRAAHGHRPPTAHDVGAAHEWSLGAARGGGGVFYTPTALVAAVLDRATDGLVAPDAGGEAHAPPTVLDPACGTGAFLLAALDRLAGPDRARRRATVTRLHGVDVDPVAVALCRALLWLAVGDEDLDPTLLDATVRVGDALTSPLHPGVPPLPRAALAPRGTDDRALAAQHRRAVRALEATGRIDRRRWVAAWTLRPSAAVASGDALVAALDAEALRRPTLDWPTAFPGPLGDGGFDLVVGNPPYVRGRVHAQEDPHHRALVGHLHATCHGATWNLWLPFVERADLLARRRSALLVQSAVLGAQFVAPLHARLRERGRVRAIVDLAGVGGFDDAEVNTAAIVTGPPEPGDRDVAFVRHRRDGTRLVATVRRRPAAALAALPDGYWRLPLSDLDPADVATFLEATTRLGDLVVARDGMEQTQAYSLRRLVRERDDVPADVHVVRLVTTGAIDPWTTTWGTRPVRFLGDRWRAPVLVVDELAAAHPELAERATSAKVAVAGLATRLEAVADADGLLLVSKSAMELRARPDVDVDVHAVAALLNDDRTTRIYRAAFGGLGFGGSGFNVRPAGLRHLPLPAADALAPGGHLSRRGRSAASPVATVAVPDSPPRPARAE